MTPHDEFGRSFIRPAPRHAGRFANESLPKVPSFNEADVSDKPERIRTRRLLTDAEVRSITSAYRSRLEALLAVDEGVAAIVDALRRSGELGESVVMFTSDNGLFQGEHRLPGRKSHVYQEAAKVPLLMRGPGFPAGRVVGGVVSNVDLAPTIVALTGARAGRTMDGIPLAPVASQPSIVANRKIVMQASHGGAHYRAIHTGRYVYVQNTYGERERELYDLQSDPYQLTSLHGSPAHASIRDGLAADLAKLWGCRGGTCHQVGTTPTPTGPVVSISDRSKTEADSGTPGIGLKVEVTGTFTSSVKVSWATSNGTAVAPADYAAASGRLTFYPGKATVRYVTVGVVADTVREPNETFHVTLSSPANAALGRATATGTIVNDD